MPHATRVAFPFLVLVLAAGGLTGVSSAASGTAAPAERAPAAVRFDFESGPARGGTATGFNSTGSTPARLVARNTGGVPVRTSAGPRGGGLGVRFPAWTDSGTGRAAVLVSTPGSRAAVAPGSRTFTFGASFRLDRRSSGTRRDNGDNLVQRGTYGGRGQFKIQLDRRVPSCRVKGDAGTRLVRARQAVVPNRWYAVSCRRTATGLRLSVQSYARGAKASVTLVSGRTGNIVAGAHRFSVGGKVTAQGAPQPSSDQFNGAVDNVYLRLG